MARCVGGPWALCTLWGKWPPLVSCRCHLPSLVNKTPWIPVTACNNCIKYFRHECFVFMMSANNCWLCLFQKGVPYLPTSSGSTQKYRWWLYYAGRCIPPRGEVPGSQLFTCSKRGKFNLNLIISWHFNFSRVFLKGWMTRQHPHAYIYLKDLYIRLCL